jgi:hypothetical protein
VTLTVGLLCMDMVEKRKEVGGVETETDAGRTRGSQTNKQYSLAESQICKCISDINR